MNYLKTYSFTLAFIFMVCIHQSCRDISNDTCTIQLTNKSDKPFESARLTQMYLMDGKVSLYKDSCYTLTLPAGYYNLYIGNVSNTIYLEPSFDIQFIIDGDEYTCTGKGATENNFLRDKAVFEAPLKQKMKSKQLGMLSEEDFIARIDSVYSCYIKHLEENKKELSASFYYLENEDLYYRFEDEKVMFGSNKAYSIGDINWESSEAYVQKLYSGEINLNNDLLITSYNYINYLSSYFYHQLDESGVENAIYDRIEKALTEIESALVKEVYVMQSVRSEMSRVGCVEEYYELIEPILTTTENKKYVKKKYDKLIRVLPGKPSPNFSLADNHGDTISLDHFHGKYVYIDIWSSSCSPCLADQPYINELKRKYKGKDIQFVGMNILDDQETWLSTLKTYDMMGLHLHCNTNELDFIRAYGVHGIPRYILLDKEGLIIDSSAKRPYDPELENQFNRLLTMN